MRRKRFLGLRHGLRVGVREGETLSPGCFGSTCARGLGECFRGASGEATYGEWVGVMARSVPQFACTGHDTPSTERPDPKLRNRSLSFASVPLSEPTLTEAADGTHKAGEKRVGVSGESGRWVSRADSRRKNRAERRVGAAPRRRAAALHFGSRAPKNRLRIMPTYR